MSSNKLVADLELLGFQWHLCLDIWSNEDILQIHPFTLSLYPLLHDLHDKLDVLGELLSAGFDGFDVSVGKCVVDVGKRFIEDYSKFVHLAQHVAIFVRLYCHV